MGMYAPNSCAPETGCVNTANTEPCDDGDACTTGDTCSNFLCLGGEPTECGDDNPCTLDGCEKDTGCVYTNAALACDDGNACTDNDTCSDGACTGTPKTEADCDDGNPCTTDSCLPESDAAISLRPVRDMWKCRTERYLHPHGMH